MYSQLPVLLYKQRQGQICLLLFYVYGIFLILQGNVSGRKVKVAKWGWNEKRNDSGFLSFLAIKYTTVFVTTPKQETYFLSGNLLSGLLLPPLS